MLLSHSGMRKEIKSAADAIRQNIGASRNIVFICTHNSRRSQFAAFWAQYWADMQGLNFAFFSAGTEKTTVYPAVIDALKKTGIPVEKSEEKHTAQTTTRCISLFSKTLGDDSIPKSFHAITTCSEADENCPFIPQAVTRFHLPYEDPKWSDGQRNEGDVYAQKCLEIKNDMAHFISLLNSK
jgi:protein-tyrosine-phosphatase